MTATRSHATYHEIAPLALAVLTADKQALLDALMRKLEARTGTAGFADEDIGLS